MFLRPLLLIQGADPAVGQVGDFCQHKQVLQAKVSVLRQPELTQEPPVNVTRNFTGNGPLVDHSI